MNIWIVKISEPLPIAGETRRLMRAGLISAAALRRGHQVLWWTSTFDHWTKTASFTRTTVKPFHKHGNLVLMNGGGYRRHVSPSRFMDHQRISYIFRHLARRTQTPDLILCSYPDIFLAHEAVVYARQHGVPIVVDARDQWPDLFLDLAPKAIRPAAALALSGLFRRARRVFRGATALTGITESFLSWALRKAGRTANAWDAVYPLAYPNEELSVGTDEQAFDQWRVANGITNRGPLVVYFGTIGRHFDLATVVRAAARPQCRGMQFVLCGVGPDFNAMRNMARQLECSNVAFPGMIGGAEIRTLMQRSFAGLAPYRRTPDFMSSVPNKIIEYLSGGLPIATTLGGETGNLLDRECCGAIYPDGDDAALAGLLASWLGNPDAVAGMRSRARALFTREYDASVVYDNYVERFERMCAIAKGKSI